MRPIWSGAISFGLINIPVRLYSATMDHSLHFDMLHKKDLSPIRYAKFCKTENVEIPYEEIVKGYEYKKGEYVVVTNEDFEQVNPQKTKTIEIICFALEKEVDSVYYEKPYILEPDKNSKKAYTLLREALKHSKKVAVAKLVMHNREHMAIIKPYERAVLLQQIRFQSDLRNFNELELPLTGKGLEKEIDMALKLIDQLTDKFTPEDYKDTYTDELKDIIAAKLKGIKVSPKTKEPELTPVKDIMTQLKASLKKYRPSTSAQIRKKAAKR